jgi:uncharacterized membrane protein YbhN (UPF0104 family)
MIDRPPTANKRPIGQIIRIAGSVLAIGLLGWLLIQQDWREIGQNVTQIGLLRFLVAVGLLIGSRIAISFRWYALLRSARQPIDYLGSLRLTFAGLFGNNFLPSTIGGDGIRLAGAIQAGWDGAVAAASLVMDRLVGMAGMAVLLPFAFSKGLAFLRQGCWLGGTLAAGMTASDPDSPRWKKAVAWGRQQVVRIWETIVLWVRQPGTLVMPFLFTFLHMAFTFGAIWEILAGLGEQLGFFELGGLWAVVYFITLLPISIGGLGLQEWAIWLIFFRVGGITEQHSLTLALLFRTLMMLSSLPGAVFVPGIMERGRQASPPAKPK